MAYDQDSDGKPGRDPADPTPRANWWEGPPPAGYTGPWPPQLPPGASYGPNFGQIIYAPGTSQQDVPTYTPPTDTTTSPDYHPEWWNQPTAPGDPITPKPPPPPPPPAPSPTPTPTPMPSGAAPAGTSQPTFAPAPYTAPPAMQAPPPFSYANFVAPDPNELQNDPLFKYTLQTQQDAIQRSAAAEGILNTGGTINDLLLNARDISSTGYQDLWGRKMGEYNTNRGNAFENYKTNYGIGKDVYDTNYSTQYTDPYKFGYQGSQDTYNAQQHNFDLNRQYGWYGTLFDYQKDQDIWDRKFKLLGLA